VIRGLRLRQFWDRFSTAETPSKAPGSAARPDEKGRARAAERPPASKGTEPRRPRPIARILSLALITAGLVILTDVAVTLAWKEPLSALYGEVQQELLEDDVAALEDSFPEVSGPSQAELRREAKALARRLAATTGQGEGIGRLSIPAIDAEFALVEGTDMGSLRQGPGHYSGTALPGAGTTVGIAGHRTTYLAPFRDIDELEGGDAVVLAMPYATLTYLVDRARVVEPTELSVIRKRRDERLVLTTCHPVYSAAQRYVVFADLETVAPPLR
jgi:sortase A